MLWVIAATLVARVAAAAVTLPLAYQDPPAARLTEPFAWTISPSTFTPTPASYSASVLPSWLSFNGTTGAFTGSPTRADLGSFVVTIYDGSGDSDIVTLTVSSHSGNVTVCDPVVGQLNASSVSSAFPLSPLSPWYPGVRVPPGWSFSLGFQPDTFAAPTKVYYEAALAGGGPLPPWLHFANGSVTFDGVAPWAPGQGWQVALQGGDVLGYADAAQVFSVYIGAHDFQQVQPPIINLSVGEAMVVDDTWLDVFEVDGDPIAAANATLALATPDWMSYNGSLAGVAPASLAGTNTSIALNVTNQYNDTLVTALTLAFFPSLFTATAPTASVNAKTFFDIELSHYLTSAVYNLTANTSAPWVTFHASNNSLTGVAPTSGAAAVTLHALDVATSTASRAQLSITVTPSAAHHRGLGTGAKVAVGAVLGSVLGLVLLCVLMSVCRKYVAAEKRPVDEEKTAGWSQLPTPASVARDKFGNDDFGVDAGPHVHRVGMARVPAPVISESLAARTKRFMSGSLPGHRKSRLRAKISAPVVQPHLDNAAYQAQLALAIDAAGIVSRGGTYAQHEHDAASSQMGKAGPGSARRTVGESASAASVDARSMSSGFERSSRASWESEPPFAWTAADRVAGGSDDTHASSSSSSTRATDANRPVQRADFRPSPPHQAPPARAPTPASPATSDLSIDNIHFPSDSDLQTAETEGSGTDGGDAGGAGDGDDGEDAAVIATASRVTAVGAATPGHSRLVSFKARTVHVQQPSAGAGSHSETAFVGSVSGTTAGGGSPTRDGDSGSAYRTPPSLPSLPALPGIDTAPQRVLIGVDQAFHFYPPLDGDGGAADEGGARLQAYIEVKEGGGTRLEGLPPWLHLTDGELWGVPREEDRGTVRVRIVENGRIRGRFAIEVSWRALQIVKE